jgi:hypothetical protein
MASSSGGAVRSRRRRLADAVPLLAPLVLAAALAGAAVVTVEQAGCDDVGHYVVTERGVEFTGGCLTPSQLPHGVPHRDTGDLDARRG